MLRNRPDGYGSVAIVLHWTIALLFIGQIGLGFLTQAVPSDPALQFSLYQWHKSFGFLILALALARILWALTGARPAPEPGAGRVEGLAAHAAHIILRALTVLVPLAGWAVVSSSPLGIPSFVFDLFVMPNLPLPVSDAWEALWSRLHAILAYGAGVLVLAHALAALYHHAVRRDATLRRMLGLRRQAG